MENVYDFNKKIGKSEKYIKIYVRRHIYKNINTLHAQVYIDTSLCISYQFVVKCGKYTNKKNKNKNKKVERKMNKHVTVTI